MAVFHLKYRPTKFGELDSVEAAELLKKILLGKEIPQSFLFTGPKGAGKTSASRIMARAINCENPDGVEPCGKCENCKEIMKGSSIDIIEIDAASNRGIEDIRLLKDKAYLLPSKLKIKVFIIDEVHMLTKEAFNALLKLIEEPPKHTVFILCTTDPEKIPETVLSRLIKIEFKKGNKKELKKSLTKIIEGEKVEIDDKSIETIIDKSDGSFRNLHKTFNELILEYGNKISFEKTNEYFESKRGDYNEADLELDLSEGNIKKILVKFEELADKGVDFGALRLKYLEYFQKRLLASYGVGDIISGTLSGGEIEKFLGLLIVAGRQEKDVSIEQLPLELAVVDFVNEVGNGDGKKKEETELKKKEPEEVIKEDNLACDVTISQEEVTIPGKFEIADIEKEWGNILLKVKPFNHSVEAFLRAARPKAVRGSIVVLEVFYPFHKDRLEENKNKKIVETVFTNIFGVNLGFECVLGKVKKEPLVINNDTVETGMAESKEMQNNTEKKDIYDVAKDIFG